MRRTAHGLRTDPLRSWVSELALGGSLLAGLLLASLTQGAERAAAHGPAPVALAVLAHDEERPSLLRTNLGLARADDDRTYRYVCPSRWDGNELALSVASASGEEIFVVSDGVGFVSLDGGCTFEGVTSRDLYVGAFDATDRGFVLVAEDYPTDLDPDSSHVLEVVGGVVAELALDLTDPIDGVVGLRPEPGFIVSGAGDRVFFADASGTVSTVALEEPAPSRLTPRAARGGVIWLRAAYRDGVELVRVERADVQRGPRVSRVHGPVLHDGRWLALMDGILSEWSGAQWRTLEPVDWTCLHSLGGQSFACGLDLMRELGADGTTTPIFSMQQLGPPEACGTEAQQMQCEQDWAHFGGEPGWLDTRPALSPTTGRRPPGGCAMTPGLNRAGSDGHRNTRGPAALLPLAVLLGLRRRR